MIDFAIPQPSERNARDKMVVIPQPTETPKRLQSAHHANALGVKKVSLHQVNPDAEPKIPKFLEQPKPQRPLSSYGKQLSDVLEKSKSDKPKASQLKPEVVKAQSVLEPVAKEQIMQLNKPDGKK